MAEAEFTAVAPLDGGHDRTPFDCGVPALNLYLRNYALQNQQKGIVRNYVTTRVESKDVVAYYSLVYAAIDQKRLRAAEIAGLKLLLVHAKDEAAADFYRKHGFEPVVDDPLKLFLPVPLSPG